MKRVLYLLIALAIAVAALFGCGRQITTGITKEQAAEIAEEHLRRYAHYPPVVERVEVEEGEGEANRYWERFGQPPIESPPKRRCWIVRLYYPGPCEGSYLAVYVDKESGEVIGGTQTK